MNHHIQRLLLLLVSIAGPALAQGRRILIVDPGTSPYTISATLALASAGDVVLVRDGTYQERVTMTRGISLLAHPGHQPMVQGWIHVTGVPQGETATVKGFQVFGPVLQTLADASPLLIWNCPGTVVVTSTRVVAGQLPGSNRLGSDTYGNVDIRGCAAVLVEDVRSESRYGRWGVLMVQCPQVFLVGGQYRGGDAGCSPGFCQMSANSPGSGLGFSQCRALVAGVSAQGGDSLSYDSYSAPGMLVDVNCEVFVTSRLAAIVGGTGPQFMPLPGGSGLYVDPTSQVYLDGDPFQGGAPGNSGGTQGPKYQTLIPSPRQLPLLTKVPVFLDRNAAPVVRLATHANQLMLLLLGDRCDGPPIPGIPEPIAISSSTLLVLLGAMATDQNGIATLQLHVPADAGLVGQSVFLQAFGPGASHLLVSNPVGDTIR